MDVIKSSECPEPPAILIELMCPGRTCHSRVTITKSQLEETCEKGPDGLWRQVKPILCKMCGKKMLYHKDVKKE